MLSSIPKYAELRDKLINIRDSRHEKWKYVIAGSMGFSKLDKRIVWNDELNLKMTEFSKYRTSFWNFLVKIGEVAEFRKGDVNAPHIIKKLFASFGINKSEKHYSQSFRVNISLLLSHSIGIHTIFPSTV